MRSTRKLVSELIKGDIIVGYGEVTALTPSTVTAGAHRVYRGIGYNVMPSDAEVTIVAREPQVGDRVCLRSNWAAEGELVAIASEFAFVLWDDRYKAGTPAGAYYVEEIIAA